MGPRAGNQFARPLRRGGHRLRADDELWIEDLGDPGEETAEGDDTAGLEAGSDSGAGSGSSGADSK